MRTFKPEGATHYSKRDGMRGTLWYKRCERTGEWVVWWSAKQQWGPSALDDASAAVALRAVVSDTPAIQ